MKNWYLIVLFSVGGLSNTPLSVLPTEAEIRHALNVISSQRERSTSISDRRSARNAWIAWHSFIAEPWNMIHKFKEENNAPLRRKDPESLITFKQNIDQQLSPEKANHYAIANGLIRLAESKGSCRRNLELTAQIQILIETAKSYQTWLTKKNREITAEIQRKPEAPRIPSRGKTHEPRAHVPQSAARSKSRSAERPHSFARPPDYDSDDDLPVLASLHTTSDWAGGGGSFGDSVYCREIPDDHLVHASRLSQSGGAGRPPAHAARPRSRSPHHSPARTAHTHSRSPDSAPRPSRSPSPRRASSIDELTPVIALNPSRQKGNNCAICAILNAQALFAAAARTPLEHVVLPNSTKTSSSREGFNQTIIKADVLENIRQINRQRNLTLGTSDSDIKQDMNAINTDSMIKILKNLNLMRDDDMFNSSETAELAIVENKATTGNSREVLSARYNEHKRIVTIFYVGEQRTGAVGHWVCTVYQKQGDGSQTIYRADSEYSHGNRSADITTAEVQFGMELIATD